MFTIKHINPRGEERLVECDRFAVERRSDGFAQYMAYGPVSLDGDYIATWCGDDSNSRTLVDRHALYVMNRHGTTVSTHVFGEPDHSNVPAGAACADPALLAQVSV